MLSLLHLRGSKCLTPKDYEYLKALSMVMLALLESVNSERPDYLRLMLRAGSAAENNGFTGWLLVVVQVSIRPDTGLYSGSLTPPASSAG